MSRKHAAHTYQVQHLIKQVGETDPDYVYQDFGIEIYDDGTVYDACADKEFNTIAAWAEYTVEQEEIEDEQPVHNSKWVDE